MKFKRQIGLGQYAGVSLAFHISWLVFLPLGIAALALGPLVTAGSNWLLAIITILLMTLSVVLHEVGHLVTAVARGLSIRQIILYPFGGVSRMGSVPLPAGPFIQMTLAGPLVSLLQAGIWLVVWWLGDVVIFLWLAQFNLLLGLLNLLPVPRLDGSRLMVLLQNSPLPSQVAASVSFLTTAYLAVGFTLSGGAGLLFGLFLTNVALVMGGLLLVLAGLLLQAPTGQTALIYTPAQINKLAQTSVTQLLSLQVALVAAADLGICSGTSMPPGSFPAVRGGSLGWLGGTGNGYLSMPTLQPWFVSPTTSLLQALHTLDTAAASRLLVVEDWQIIGTLSHEQILQHLHQQEVPLLRWTTDFFILLKQNEPDWQGFSPN